MASCVVYCFLKFFERDMLRHFDDGLTRRKIHLYVSNSLNSLKGSFNFVAASLAAHARDRICVFHGLLIWNQQVTTASGRMPYRIPPLLYMIQRFGFVVRARGRLSCHF